MSSNLELLASFMIRQARVEVAPPSLYMTAPEGTVASEPRPLTPDPAKDSGFVSLDPMVNERPLPSAPPAEVFTPIALPAVMPSAPPCDIADPLTDRDPYEHEDEPQDLPRDDWGEIMYGACGYPCDGRCWHCVRVGDYYESMNQDRFDMADEI